MPHTTRTINYSKGIGVSTNNPHPFLMDIKEAFIKKIDPNQLQQEGTKTAIDTLFILFPKLRLLRDVILAMDEHDERLLIELILGDWYEGEVTTEGTIGNIAVDVTPVLGQIADLRDIFAVIRNIFRSPSKESWANLAWAILCCIPILGAIKILKKAKKGRKVGLTKKLTRFFFEDRVTFNASKDFFKRWRWVFGKKHGWSMEHLIGKQRWVRGAEKNLLFKKGTWQHKILQGFTDSGLNVILVPQRFNKWLDTHRKTSILFTTTVYYLAIRNLLFAIENITDLIDGSHEDEEISWHNLFDEFF